MILEEVRPYEDFIDKFIYGYKNPMDLIHRHMLRKEFVLRGIKSRNLYQPSLTLAKEIAERKIPKKKRKPRKKKQEAQLSEGMLATVTLMGQAVTEMTESIKKAAEAF